ncbi:MAG: DUF1501 domain-containing protein [Phycisphaeraceae bacterium]|nr:MAG: DUF1501 domain-containing protein [Phycisphaeraceae bacterium]
MDPLERRLIDMTRRRFFLSSAGTLMSGFGLAALTSLHHRAAAGQEPGPADVLSAARTHAPKARRVIYMHMEGAPSHLDLFDFKPGLKDRFNQDLPDSIRDGQRLTGMTSGQARFPVAPSLFRFTKATNRQDGVFLSELIPHTASIARDLCFIHSMKTDAINHEPGITFFQTGHQQPGRPSFGSWMSYGLGSSNANLPAFVVLISQGFGNMQALSSRFWGSGFLPSEHQGCRLRTGDNAVLYLKDPAGVSREDRRRMLDAANRLNEEDFDRTLDPEARARIAQAEMAFRMQMSVPELTDFSDEDQETLDLYGPNVRTPGSFAANCLLARRLAERGVRFIQLYMRGWDQHNDLPRELRLQCNAVDQPQAALIQDLKRRGLLDDTLVLWAGEFGRTVYSQGQLTETTYGRDHHPRCFTVFLSGGGIKPGITHGATDDFGYNIVKDPVDVHDLHATMLHLLGLDHQRLTFRHQGRDYRLTDVFGNVVKPILA